MAKYYRADCTWPAPISNASSKSLWKFISQLSSLVADWARRIIGNGSTTSFWNDFWLDCGVLSTEFPRLFCIAQHPEATVADAWISSSSA